MIGLPVLNQDYNSRIQRVARCWSRHEVFAGVRFVVEHTNALNIDIRRAVQWGVRSVVCPRSRIRMRGRAVLRARGCEPQVTPCACGGRRPISDHGEVVPTWRDARIVVCGCGVVHGSAIARKERRASRAVGTVRCLWRRTMTAANHNECGQCTERAVASQQILHVPGSCRDIRVTRKQTRCWQFEQESGTNAGADGLTTGLAP
jgi:hypothetical protein